MNVIPFGRGGISVIYITARHARSFVGHSDWDQYRLIGESLGAQTFRNFEVIFVTPFVDEVAPAFGPGCIVGGCWTPPRDTPWRRAHTRCAASARNTGLVRARGDYVVCLDDGVTLEPDYLERVVGYLERGLGVATLTANAAGEIVDGRAQLLEDADVALVKGGVALGLVAAPTELLLDLGGWDEHYDGGYGMEDADLGVRLARAGLSMAVDRHIYARLHDTTPLAPEVVAPDDDPADPQRSNVRCCNNGFVLAREIGRQRANEVPYTPEQIERRLHCPLLREGNRCAYWDSHGGGPCAYPHMAREGHPVARRIMVDEAYPETIDLNAERRRLL